jgi:LuxR family maltose regulon positive regulatory protein
MWPVAWLTLDAEGANLTEFVRGTTNAVRAVAPAFGGVTQPPLSEQAPEDAEPSATLLRELDALDERLVLVLEDYDTVQDPAVHGLVDTILKSAPANLHVVVVAHMDPPLRLHRLLASGRMHALRHADLEFSRAEASTFLGDIAGVSLESAELDRVYHAIGGWPTGLRLLALSLTDPAKRAQLLERLPDTVREARSYLCAQVYEQRSANTRRFLLGCALLGEFDIGLCNAVSAPDCEGMTAREFIEHESALVVAVPESPGRFRLHALMRDNLAERLHEELDADSICSLHDRAAGWLARQDRIGEAIEHALRGSDPKSAARLLGSVRIEYLNEGRYAELSELASKLPRDVLDSDIETCLLQVWIAPYELFGAAVERVESLLRASDRSEVDTDAVRGELHLMRLGTLVSRPLEFPDDLAGLIASGERALELLPAHHRTARAMASHYLAQANCLAGDSAAAKASLVVGLEEHTLTGGHPLTVILYAQTYLEYAAGNLTAARDAAERCQACIPSLTTGTMLAWVAVGLLGVIHFQWNELERAEELLELAGCAQSAESMVFLAQVRQAQGRHEEARALVATYIEAHARAGAEASYQFGRARDAQLLLMEGDAAPALQWATSAQTGSFRTLITSMTCTLSRAEILILAGTSSQRATAQRLLRELAALTDRGHHGTLRINIAVLEALRCDAEGDEKGALASLSHALTLSAPGRFVRRYVDLGPRMAALLARVRPPDGLQDYVDLIRAAFARAAPPPATRRRRVLPDPLTDRELEILSLLARRLSNQEIANQLFITVPPVKSHATTIYSKLHVHRRREAVEKAIALGILRDG